MFWHLKKYLTNCFLLFVPILVWDPCLASKLPRAFQPEVFWYNIPSGLTYAENLSRTLLFVAALLMPLNWRSAAERKGLVLYLIGLLIYFLSWIWLICFPASSWSRSCFGFMAPAYTPILWLTGIGLMGNRFYFGIPFHRLVFWALSIVFVIFHCVHTYIVFYRVYIG